MHKRNAEEPKRMSYL